MHLPRTTFFLVITGFSLLAKLAVAADAPPITQSAVIEAPIEQVWDSYTTKKGIEAWMLPHAEFELKVGGLMRTNYHEDGVIGDKNTIVNRVMSYQPQRMLSIQVAQAPEGFAFPHAVQSMWTVLMFEPVSSQQTKLTITGMGFTDDEESQKLRKFFEAGNLYTLQKLREHFAASTKAAAVTSDAEEDAKIVTSLTHEASAEVHATPKSVENDALTVLRTLIGGEWIAEQKRGDGEILRVRNVFEDGPDGHSVIGRGWRGDADGVMPHASTQVWCEPLTGKNAKDKPCIVRFQSLNEIGAVARGDIIVTGDREIEWDWTAVSLEGQQERYRVKMTFDKPDQYRFVLSLVAQGEKLQQLVDLRFTRVQTVPETFRKIKAGH